MISMEEENFLRIVYLYYRVVTPALKRFFDGTHPNLSTDLNISANKTKILQLYKPLPGQTRVLYKQQIDTLYPLSGKPPVASADIDLTLMVCLLRNLPPVVITPPTGFDKLPPKHDLSDGANIARIKYYKNYLVSHSTSGKIVVSVFNDIWTDLEMAIKGLGNSQDFADANLAKTKIMDSSMTTLLSTQQQLHTKVSRLEDQLTREQCNKTEIETQIKRIEEQTFTTETNTKQLIEESKSNMSSTVQEMQDESNGKLTQINTKIEILEKDQTEFKNLQVVLSKEFGRLDKLVNESKTISDDLQSQVELTCSDIQRNISINEERISALEVNLQEVNYFETKKDIGELKIEVKQLKTDRKNVPDWMIPKLQQWKKYNDFFVETTACNHVLRCLLVNKCVSVVGPPGIGKTFLVQHVALKMENIGFNVISVNTPNEIKQNYQLSRKMLFVVDDMCGNFTANAARLDKWKSGMKDITDILNNDSYKMDVHFSHHCGENIELSKEKQKVSWNHKYSGGIAFSSQPLRPNSKLKLDLTGTGHAYVGIIKRDPASVTNMRKALTSGIIVATEVKVHKRLGAVNIVSDTKDGKDCISFESYNGTKTVDINSEVWLFLYIKFGDMIAVLHSETTHDRCFHQVTGCNIRCLDEDRRSVKLLVENPAAVCCLNKKLKPGHSVTIQTKAISENRNKPSRCHIKLGIINIDPSELKSRDPESFQVDSKVACPTRWNIVQTFSKENIDGELKLYLTHTGELYFSHDSGIEGTHKCHLNDASNGISIILDLFRAEASVTDYHHEESEECEEKDYDYVRPEVEISETIKRKLQISDKQHEKESSSTDRSSSDSDYLEMKNVSDSHKTFSPNCKISPRLTRCGMYRKDNSSSNVQECK